MRYASASPAARGEIPLDTSVLSHDNRREATTLRSPTTMSRCSRRMRHLGQLAYILLTLGVDAIRVLRLGLRSCEQDLRGLSHPLQGWQCELPAL
jgi:hypothetical protein